jgi:hypothetical protein
MHGDPGTKQRRSLLGGKRVRNLDYVAGWGLGKFGISAIRRDAGDALTHTQILVAFAAKLTLPACPLDPRHSDALAYLYTLDCRASLYHPAYDLVAEDQRLLYNAGQLRPIAVGHVQIGMTDAANLYFDQDFVLGTLRPRHFLQG